MEKYRINIHVHDALLLLLLLLLLDIYLMAFIDVFVGLYAYCVHCNCWRTTFIYCHICCQHLLRLSDFRRVYGQWSSTDHSDHCLLSSVPISHRAVAFLLLSTSSPGIHSFLCVLFFLCPYPSTQELVNICKQLLVQSAKVKWARRLSASTLPQSATHRMQNVAYKMPMKCHEMGQKLADSVCLKAFN